MTVRLPLTYRRGYHWYSVFLAGCTLLLLIAGGLVTSTGSGLAVPDWPLSYGMLMPPMVGGIFYEHGHRMIASTVGLLTVIQFLWIVRTESRRWVRWLSGLALGSVVLQGVLGGLTVLFLLPTAISASHATLAQTFFCMVATIAVVTSRWWLDKRTDQVRSHQWRILLRFGAAAVLAVYLQLILGAVMRHMDAGLAVPDFPYAYGQIVPSLSDESLNSYNQQLIHQDIRLAADGAITANQIFVHMAHRFWSIIAVTTVLLFARKAYRAGSQEPRLRVLASILAIDILIQFGLGALTVLTRKSVLIATAHQTNGALILMTCVVASVHVARMISWNRPAREFALQANGVVA